jgi:hypothetical protein
MVKHNNLIETLTIWGFTLFGFITQLLPIIQLISLLLAIAVSCITIYKFLKGKK